MDEHGAEPSTLRKQEAFWPAKWTSSKEGWFFNMPRQIGLNK